jgi:pimeloyl-ACP methyl ester carboxylesterase
MPAVTGPSRQRFSATKKPNGDQTERGTNMPTIANGEASIYYEEHGTGFPILAFAPGGIPNSKITVWGAPMAPLNAIAEWSTDYRVIVMDQRNTLGGRSRAPITANDGWDSYTSDHIALLDHLKIERCHLFGQCIGGSFIANMVKTHPERVAGVIWAQPIGRIGPLEPGWNTNFVEWAKAVADRPEVTEPVLDAFFHNLYGAGFLFSADREAVKNFRAPSLVLAGNDEVHPRPVSDELAALLPHCWGYLTEWKTGTALEVAKAKAKQFLAEFSG